MISPLMELSPENLRGKAFRFGIYRNRRAALLPLFGNENKPDPGCWTEPAGRARAGRWVLFCQPSLGKFGGGRVRREESFIYYDTATFGPLALAPPMPARTSRYVGYLTDAFRYLR